MKNWLKKILPVIDGLVVEPGVRTPLIPVSMFYMTSHFSKLSAGLFGVSIVSSLLSYLAILARQDMLTNKELCRFFTTMKHYKFEKIDMKKVIGKYGDYDRIQGILTQNSKLNLGIGYAAKLTDYSKKGPRISYYKAFPRNLFDNIVIFPSDTDNLTLSGQFKMFHELGHLGINHRREACHMSATTASLMHLFLAGAGIICRAKYNLSLVIPAYFWYGTSYVKNVLLNRKVGNNVNIEKFADSFAYFMLKDKEGFEEFVKAVKGIKNGKEGLTESLDYYDWWFEEPVNVEESSIYQALRKTCKIKWLQSYLKYGASNDALNYNIMLENETKRERNYARVLFSSLVVSAFFTDQTLSFQKFLVLTGLSIGIPGISLWVYCKEAIELEIFSRLALNMENIPEYPSKEENIFTEKFCDSIVKTIQKANLRVFHMSDVK